MTIRAVLAQRLRWYRPGWHRLAAITLVSMVLGACATTENPRDPIENYNRVIFSFNDAVDRTVIKPVAETYRDYVPTIVRSGVRNFFANLSDVWTGANNLFQLKVGDAVSDWMRVIMNTTFGLGGLYDVASESGLDKHYEDFGQTLGWWGIPSGPYVVLPLFGPSTFRDAPALGVDLAVNSTGRVASLASGNVETPLAWGLWTLSTISFRADALQTTDLLAAAAVDRYAFYRDAFLQRRQNQVYDGNPPRSRDPDAQAPDFEKKRDEPSTVARDPAPPPAELTTARGLHSDVGSVSASMTWTLTGEP